MHVGLAAEDAVQLAEEVVHVGLRRGLVPQGEEVGFGGLRARCVNRDGKLVIDGEATTSASTGGRRTYRVALQRNEEPHALEAHERALGLDGRRAFVHVEGLARAAQLLEDGPDAADQGDVVRVDLEGTAEVVVGQGVLARLEVDVAETEPDAWVRRVSARSYESGRTRDTHQAL